MFPLKNHTKERIFILIFSLLLYAAYKYYFDNDMICLCEEVDEELIKKNAKYDQANGHLELDNIKITGLNNLARAIGQAGSFAAGTAAMAKIIKNSPMPLLGKAATILVGGAGSVVTFSVTKMAVELMNNSRTQNRDVQFHAKYVSIDSSVSNSSTNPGGNSSTNPGGTTGGSSSNYPTSCASEDLDTILQSLIESLLILQCCIIYLIIQLIIFYIMFHLANKNYQFDFVKSWPYGTKIQNLLLKILEMWRKTSYIWLFILISLILIFTLASTFGIYAIYIHITS